MAFSYILVTGATGLVGAHVVDNLLAKGFRVRAVARSRSKAELMVKARPQFEKQLDFFFIDDLASPGVFDHALEGIDGVIHVASELIQPAIQGVRSLLEAAAAAGSVHRIVMTSSFGAVLDMERDMETPYTYSAADWNPITYKEAADPAATPQDAYRGSKVFAEQTAWNFVKEKKEKQEKCFDLVTLCPSMVFGPVAGPLITPSDLNESNSMLWKVASGNGTALPPARFPFWIDVRDLAELHVLALTTSTAGGKRYVSVAPENYSYARASQILLDTFPWAKGRVLTGEQRIMDHIHVDGTEVAKDFPQFKCHPFKETVVDLVKQVESLKK